MSAALSITRLRPDLERVALLGWRLAPQTRSRKGMFVGYRAAATHDLETLEGWAREYPRCNWCVATGPGSGTWALDIDVPSEDHAEDGRIVIRDLVAKHGPLPPAPWLRSGGGGSAMFFRVDEAAAALRSRTGWPKPGLDIRAANVVTTIPPSIHRRGGSFTWRVAPWELSPPVAPAWLIAACLPPPEPPRPMRPMVPTTDGAFRRLVRAVDKIITAPDGTRNATLNREAFAVCRWVGAGLISEREALSPLEQAALAAGLDRAETRETLASALRAGAAKPIEARA